MKERPIDTGHVDRCPSRSRQRVALRNAVYALCRAGANREEVIELTSGALELYDFRHEGTPESRRA